MEPLLNYGDLTIFQNGGRPPSWICFVHVSTIHDEYLVVCLTVQNLVGIDSVVSIIRHIDLCKSDMEPGFRVTGHSPGQRLWPGQVGSRVSVSNLAFDPVLGFNMHVYREVVSTD